MKRRDLLKSLFLGTAAVGAVGLTKRQRFGLLTVEGWNVHQKATGEDLHVFVDGHDVTSECFQADDVEGYALVNCRDQKQHADHTARGALHVNGAGVCRLRLTGDIQIRPAHGSDG